MNMHRQRTTIRKSAYLLAIRSLAFTFKMAENIDNQSTINTIYPKIKDRKTVAAIGMVTIRYEMLF